MKRAMQTLGFRCRFIPLLIVASLIAGICIGACSNSKCAKQQSDNGTDSLNAGHEQMAKELNEYVNGKPDALIGVAVITDHDDVVTVNGNDEFPMMSVMKFPLALAVAKWLECNEMSIDDSIAIKADELNENTYSPMLKKYGRNDMSISIRETLEWSLTESDNNACDILIKLTGGTDSTMSLLREMGLADGISICASEEDMYRNNELSYLNRSTPLAMARLFERFDKELRNSNESFAQIASMLEKCRTGSDRLAKPLADSHATIGHKTGTGFVKPDGRLMALNDCGYIHLPDNTNYYIAVFVADSGYDAETTSKIIADISEIVYNNL